MSEPALHSGARSRPLTEAKLRASRLGTALNALGVGHGERYAIVMRNEIAFLEATLAASVIGAVPIPVNWHWTGADLRHLLTDSEPKVAIVHSDLVPVVEAQAPGGLIIVEAEVPDEVASAYQLGTVELTGRHPTVEQLIAKHEPVSEPNTDPPMGVIYTSGTTGLAKGILRDPIPSEDLPKLLAAMTMMFHLYPGGRTLSPAPLYHTAPNVNATFAAALGMDITIMPKYDPVEFLRLVQERRIDTVQMVPTMFHRLLRLPRDVRESYDVSSLRAIVHAAAPCPPETKQAMIDWFGPIVYEYYGGSEGGVWVLCNSEEALSHPGTVGRPIAGADVRVLDEYDRIVPPGVTGMIYGKAMDGWPDFTYIGHDDKRRAIERDGYITVGDIGHLDEDGFLYLSDRMNDMVISGGVNIYPAEIEGCLSRMDGIADAAVFGIPDRDFGEALAAHVELLAGASISADDVRAFVAANLAKYKVPRVVVFEDRLPREDTGKLFKRRLKEPYWRQPA
jgi:long-chain acyl-CoA synthetase